MYKRSDGHFDGSSFANAGEPGTGGMPTTPGGGTTPVPVNGPGGSTTQPIKPLVAPKAPVVPKPLPLAPAPKPVGGIAQQNGSTGYNLMGQLAPKGINDAFSWAATVGNKDIGWADPNKIQSADKLRQWMDTNKNHSAVNYFHSMPAVKDMMSQLDSPTSQLARYGTPILNRFTSTPESFAQFANMPMIRDIARPVLGATGLPGLAYLYSLLSGKMHNWNTLTAGLTDPSQRVPGRNALEEAQKLFNIPQK